MFIGSSIIFLTITNSFLKGSIRYSSEENGDAKNHDEGQRASDSSSSPVWTCFIVKVQSNLLDIVNTLTVKANVSKNQLINVALYEFLKQQNVLKDELEKK